MTALRAIVGARGPISDAGLTVSHPGTRASDERFVVLADASLYYLADLRRAMGARVPAPAGDATPAMLLLSAFRAFGERCIDHLEGDFAFVVWDRDTRRLFCARDFAGRRPLFYADYHGGLAVASSIAAIATLPGFNAEPDVGTVGADAAGLFFALGDETCVRGVRSLGAGCVATWNEQRRLSVRRVFDVSPTAGRACGFDEAAEQLRTLLEDAVAERTPAVGRTAVWMSGGRDSTAVFAAGMAALRRHNRAGELFPVSRSHPVGDAGREDEAVVDIARLWNVTPRWVDVRDFPMFGADDAPPLWSTESFVPPFEQLTRGLAHAACEAGASVALDGHGGDFLFQVSPAYVADLVASGRIASAWSDWRVMNGGHSRLRGFLRAGVQPLLPPWAIRAAGTALRRPVRGILERVAPPWITRDFLADHAIEDRLRDCGPDASSRRGGSVLERETRFYLTHSFFSRVNAVMGGYARDHGLELRSPLLDRRVVTFALGRPRIERNRAGDQKRLLRAAMRGLLPDAVLAPRLVKSGTLATYFAHHMRHDGLVALQRLLPAAALTRRGIVDPAALSAAVARFALEGAAYPHVEALFCTLQAERWLRAHDGVATEPVHSSTTARSA